MGKSRKRGRRAKKDSVHGVTAPLYFARLESPFGNLDLEKRRQLISDTTIDAQKQYRIALETIEARLIESEPIALLSLVSFLHVMESNYSLPRLTKEYEIHQYHAELLQAMVLRSPLTSYGPVLITTPPDSLLQALETMAWAGSLSNLTLEEDPVELELRQLQFKMRISTLALRNWGFPWQMWEVARGMFVNLDDQTEAEFGLKFSHVLLMFRTLIEAVESRYLELAPRLAVLADDRWMSTTRQKYDSQASTHAAHLGVTSPDLQQLVDALVAWEQSSIRRVFEFSLDEMVKIYPTDIKPEVLEGFLAKITLRFGELQSLNPNHFFLANPVWKQPFILINEDKDYFIPIPYLLLSFGREILSGILVGTKQLKQPFLDSRAKYLEDKLQEMFATAFPDAECYVGSMWPTQGENENDLLVILDRVAVIVEAKSGSVSETAARGLSKSLRTNVEDLIAYPSGQTARFQEFLEQNPGPHTLPTKSRQGVNTFDTSEVKEFVRLTVTLNSLGPIYSRWPTLERAGLLDRNADIAPTMTLVDLESVLGVLPGETAKLHYLKSRTEFERHVEYTGGELDLVTLYLETGLDTAHFPKASEGHEWGLDLLWQQRSEWFEHPNLSDWNGSVKPKVVSRWARMIELLEEQKPAGWNRLGMALLDIPIEDQKLFTTKFETMVNDIQQFRYRRNEIDFIHCLSGRSNRPLVLCGQAYRGQSVDRHERIEDVIAGACERHGDIECLYIGIDVKAPPAVWHNMVLSKP